MVRRIFVEKKKEYAVEASSLYFDLKENLGIKGLQNVRIVNRYDISAISEEEYQKARLTIFSEPPVDQVYDEEFPLGENERVFAIEYLPGQFDQRADSAVQCVKILTTKEDLVIRTAQLIILEGMLSDEEFERIKKYCLNPVESREASLEKPHSLELAADIPEDVEVLNNFLTLTHAELAELRLKLGLAMSLDDLVFTQKYFQSQEKRNPTITEIRVIDTYWSDHCRHTTFQTNIENVQITDSLLTKPIQKTYEKYLQARNFVYQQKDKDISLMDIATIAMKELKKQGKLQDLDESEEINACSIEVDVDIDGKEEKWLVMFKNETHNHPTEIEPYGGAATCLGGAIRDPLSGRSYVYGAMRITGSGDPRKSVEDTLPGKLPQRKITTGAAKGYSSYGNQIGLATGQVVEFYDEGFVAKRMEIGAVIAAAPKENVVREKPIPGDVVILVGGRTGRDGIGGATGSSKEHTEDSLATCGAEVQKGNPPTERKIQRLFRNPHVSRMIKRCNDFGAGGVSVAIGELTAGLEIDLDVVPKKYAGLDGTEIAISESQERMAVVISKENISDFKDAAAAENLEATVVARVTDEKRLKMFWRNRAIVDLSRDFLDTNGVQQKASAKVVAPAEEKNYFRSLPKSLINENDLKQAWLKNLSDLNVCSQIGLVEMFDSTIGSGTVLMPLGGKNQMTPAEGLVMKIPVLQGETATASVMTFGYHPKLAKWSPFHGALYAVVEAVAKSVALGGDYKNIRLTLQEYFEKLGEEPTRWGKPLSALLGAFLAQKELGIPAIGGKDSMSGTFQNLDVPPTLVAFAVNILDARQVVSQEFKGIGSKVILIPLPRKEDETPDFEILKMNFEKITHLIKSGLVLASSTVKGGGLAEAVSKMSFGNGIGMHFQREMTAGELFLPGHGSIILELESECNLSQYLSEVNYQVLGCTTEKKEIIVNDCRISLEEAAAVWEKPLENIFPIKTKEDENCDWQEIKYLKRNDFKPRFKVAKPRVFIPVFPGTNCEYDSQRAFEKAGGLVETFIFKNLTVEDIKESINKMEKIIKNSQIIMLPGGFSAGDEPDGSGKFIAAVFRSPQIKDAVMEFLNARDGLILGICNGFQTLIKLGLLPYGEIREMSSDSPTLTFNSIGRHISRIVQTQITSTLSPWLANVDVGDIHAIPISHGEGRFIASQNEIKELVNRGQIATRYITNVNGSVEGIEGITSPDGRVFGKMAHSERIGSNLMINVPGNKDQKIFEAGVNYFS